MPSSTQTKKKRHEAQLKVFGPSKAGSSFFDNDLVAALLMS